MSKNVDISCEEALQRLFAYLDRELDAHAHHEVEDHISRCRSCFSRVEFEKRLKERLREAGRGETPEQLQARIGQLLRKY